MTWLRADRVVEAIAWGGCLDVLTWMTMANAEIRDADAYLGYVLAIEP